MFFFFDAIFLLFLVLSLPKAIKRAKNHKSYRGMFTARLRSPKPEWKEGFPKIWLNGVSVGEIASARPLVEKFEKEHPGIRLMITCTTGTGFERARELYSSHQVTAYPFDFSFVVRRFLKKIQPDLIVMMEMDLWPNFLTLAGEMHIPLAVVNGRISDRSVEGYKKIRFLMSHAYNSIGLFLAQDRVDAERAVQIGIPESAVRVGGNLKFDLLKTQASAVPGQIKNLLPDDKKSLVLASTHHDEEEQIFGQLERLNFQDNYSDWKTVLVPRHPERAASLQSMLEERGWKCLRYSDASENTKPDSFQILLIDKIGLLSSLYSLAGLCFVGGSLIPHGGQNMIEAAALGVPVLFGPHTMNFREAVSILLASEAAIQVRDASDLGDKLKILLDDSKKREELGALARQCIVSRQGAVEEIFQQLKPLYFLKED